MLEERNFQRKIKVSWCKGHATQDHIDRGLSTEIEHERNEEADKLADEGRKKHVMIKEETIKAQQRKRIARLVQTMQVKIWKLRADKLEEEAMQRAAEEDEAGQLEEIEAEWERAIKEKEGREDQEKARPKEEKAGLSWRQIQIKVPAYDWEVGEGGTMIKWKPDVIGKRICQSQLAYRIKGQTKKFRLNFPARLWEPVNWWLEQLRWSERDEVEDGKRLIQKRTTFLELVVDFELATGVSCDYDEAEKGTWGERAMLLKKVIRSIVSVRGPKHGTTMKKLFGEIRLCSSLVAFGAGRMEGLRRKPEFFTREAAIRCIAKNAWEVGELKGAAEANLQGKEFRQHKTSYAGFKCMNSYESTAIKRLSAAEGSQSSQVAAEGS